MLKNICKLECVVDGKNHQYFCDNDSTLNQIKEALFQIQKYIGQVEDNIRAESEKKEEPKPE